MSLEYSPIPNFGVKLFSMTKNEEVLFLGRGRVAARGLYSYYVAE